VEEFNNYNGVYLDSMGQIEYYSELWKVCITIDIKQLATNIRDIYFQTQNLCAVISKKFSHLKESDKTCKVLEASLNELREEFTLFLSYKPTRGLIDPLGGVLNFLIGTMDNDDRVRIDDNINQLYKNQEEIRNFQKQSTTFMKSFVDDYSDFKLLVHESLFTIEGSIRSNYYLYQEQLRRLDVVSLLQTLHLAHDVIKNKVQMFFDIIITEKLNPTVLHPLKLIKNLEEIQKQLPKKRYLPFKFNDLPNYYTHTKVSTEIYKTFATLSFEIPILSNNKFNLYKIVSFPVKINESDTIAILDVTKPLAAINPSSEVVHLLTNSDLQSCSIKLFQYFICPHSTNNEDIVSMEGDINNCILSKFKNVLNEKCNSFYKLYKFKETLYYRLENNKWLFIAPSPEELTLYCEHGDEEFYKARIKNMGTITINETCKASGRLPLIPTLLKIKKIKIDLLSANFSEDLSYLIKDLEIKNAEPIPSLNISLDQINTVEFLKSQVQDLKTVAEKPLLTEIKENKSSYILFIFFIIALIIILIILVVVIIFCFKLRAVSMVNRSANQFLALKMLKRFPSMADSLNIPYSNENENNGNDDEIEYTDDFERNKNIETNVNKRGKQRNKKSGLRNKFDSIYNLRKKVSFRSNNLK
jgi:hypothetical protein